MSQQGPGGYGGGGYGPPGAPGGYGPPGGGGYGPPGAPPPGGYPGAPPQGWGAPQQPGGYGPPGAPPGGPTPPKKTNPLLFVALGCGALVVLGGIGAFVAITLAARAAANRAAEAAGAFSAALENAADAGLLSPDAGAPGVPGQGGPSCDKAADCCKVVVSATGAANPEALSSCDTLRTNPGAVACDQALQTYRVSARLLGKTCP